MRFSTIVASAITAAAVIAAPLEKRAVTTTWVIEVVTSTATVYGTPEASSTPPPKPSPVQALQQGEEHRRPEPPFIPKPSPPAAPAPPVVPSVPVQPPTPEPTKPVQPPPSTGGSGPADYGSCSKFQVGSTPDFNSPPVSCGVSIINTINKWRSFYNKPAFEWNPTMAEASWGTLQANGGGVTMNHHLSLGSNGEVITPGFFSPGPDMKLQGDSPFEVALMGWLCEVSSDPQLHASGPSGVDQCDISRNQASISGDINGGTGHHDIFLGNYKSIGCAFRNNNKGDGGWAQFEGQWTCNFKL